MDARIFDYLTSRQLPTGRRTFAVKAMRKVALGYGDQAIVARCDESIALDRDTLAMEMAYRQGKRFESRARGQAGDFDTRIDALFAGIYSVVKGQTLEELDDADAATAFLQTVFPDGLAGLINLAFEEQLARMLVLLQRFDADLSAAVDQLGVRNHVEKLKALIPLFDIELQKESGLEVSYPMVKEAQAAGLEVFARAIFTTLATYGGRSATDIERRQALLAEYHRQNAQVGEASRRHRAIRDVDPDTGEPLGDTPPQPDAAPDVEPAT